MSSGVFTHAAGSPSSRRQETHFRTCSQALILEVSRMKSAGNFWDKRPITYIISGLLDPFWVGKR